MKSFPFCGASSALISTLLLCLSLALVIWICGVCSWIESVPREPSPGAEEGDGKQLCWAGKVGMQQAPCSALTLGLLSPSAVLWKPSWNGWRCSQWEGLSWVCSKGIRPCRSWHRDVPVAGEGQSSLTDPIGKSCWHSSFPVPSLPLPVPCLGLLYTGIPPGCSHSKGHRIHSHLAGAAAAPLFYSHFVSLQQEGLEREKGFVGTENKIQNASHRDHSSCKGKVCSD